MSDKNIWMYSTIGEQQRIAAGLISFGAQNFKTAKIITHLDELEKIVASLNTNGFTKNIGENLVHEFSFSYLIDTIKIIIFFENYMKAELLIRNFLIHKINGKLSEFKSIENEQKRRPINLNELQILHPFKTDIDNKTISHKALLETTLGITNLLASEYRKCYTFDNSLYDRIQEFRDNRNKLHFQSQIEISLSESLISDLRAMNNFVDTTLKRIRE